jgi:hypothetical protein
MKGKLSSLKTAGILMIACTSLGFAQGQMSTPPQQPSPIHPGEVNYIEGQVALNGTNLESNLLRSTVMHPGDDLSTGQGYAEVLLTPGAFLRIGHNSEVRLTTTGLTETQVSLIHGSALLEAADVVKGSILSVTLGNSTAQLQEKGLYSFDASKQTVKVLDGKLKLADSSIGQAQLSKGDQVILSSDRPLKKHDFSMKAAEQDPLYVWSKVRSYDEAQATMNVADVVAANGGWYGPGWYWDPVWSFYAFAPGWGYLGGPFGWNYYSPVFLYGGYWGGGFYRAGFYGHGLYRAHYVAGLHSFNAGGGMHAMAGGGGRR